MEDVIKVKGGRIKYLKILYLAVAVIVKVKELAKVLRNNTVNYHKWKKLQSPSKDLNHPCQYNYFDNMQ